MQSRAGRATLWAGQLAMAFENGDGSRMIRWMILNSHGGGVQHQDDSRSSSYDSS